MLRGMGFANTTPIYLASGNIYEADKNIAPLRKMFPLLRSKDLLATPNELSSFQVHTFLCINYSPLVFNSLDLWKCSSTLSKYCYKQDAKLKRKYWIQPITVFQPETDKKSRIWPTYTVQIDYILWLFPILNSSLQDDILDCKFANEVIKIVSSEALLC